MRGAAGAGEGAGEARASSHLLWSGRSPSRRGEGSSPGSSAARTAVHAEAGRLGVGKGEALGAHSSQPPRDWDEIGWEGNLTMPDHAGFRGRRAFEKQELTDSSSATSPANPSTPSQKKKKGTEPS